MVVVSVVAVAEVSVDTETPTEVEAVGDKELLSIFSSAVQAVNVPAAKNQCQHYCDFLFHTIAVLSATSISKVFQISRVF